jgi:hypothetical protein
VSPPDQEFIPDIELREKAGTPGVLQTMKAALAFEVKRTVTIEVIEAREQALLARAFERWNANPNIEILGNRDPARRIGIFSFNVKDPRGRQRLHPKFLTALLNDLFGIQSRAGCSCAGPYGHRLLGIDSNASQRYRSWVKKGYEGIKPGWCRVGLHFAMDDAEADYVIDAVDFVGRHGYVFLPLYEFDLHTGSWSHKEDTGLSESFSLQAALDLSNASNVSPMALPARRKLYATYLAEAREWAQRLKPHVPNIRRLTGELGELQYFVL